MRSVLFPVALLLLGGCCLYLISNNSLLPVRSHDPALESSSSDSPLPASDRSVGELPNNLIVKESQHSVAITNTPTSPVNLTQEQNDVQETQGLRKMDLVDPYKAKQSQDLAVTTRDTPASTFKLTQVQNSPQKAQGLLKMELVVVPYFSYNVSKDRLLEREKEYVTVLQRNLNHDLVHHVHVLTTDAEETWQRLKKYEMPNQYKLIVSKLKSVDLMRDIFDYISLNLVGKDVMFLNADIYLGSGFDRVDPVAMRRQKIMYTLTRHVAEEESCGNRAHGYCQGRYSGSHDSFLFHLHEPIPESALKQLNYKLASLGMENVLIWVFQRKLNYCTLNPCTILVVFHLHCSEVRNHQNNPRANHGGNTGMSPFTEKLVCNR